MMNPLSARRGSRPERLRVGTLMMMMIGICILVVTTGSFFGGVLHFENPNGDRIDVVISPQRAIQTSRTSLTRNRAGPPTPPTLGGNGGPEKVAKLFEPSDLKLPTPILVMGLMKAGTTSIYGYFRCGLDPKTSKLSHYDCKGTSTDAKKIGMSCGKRIRRNLTKMKKPAFYTIDDFTLYAELDGQENNGGMTLPQWDYLQDIYNQFPTATWILNWRQPEKWLTSVDRWLDLRQRFIDNSFLPDLPRGVGADDKDMIQFYQRQAERIRDFCAKHPSLSCVEVPIDSPDAGTIMENAFGIPKICWGNRNANNGTAIWSPS